MEFPILQATDTLNSRERITFEAWSIDEHGRRHQATMMQIGSRPKSLYRSITYYGVPAKPAPCLFYSISENLSIKALTIPVLFQKCSSVILEVHYTEHSASQICI